MTKINCRLYCHSLSPHIQQLYTGLSMLEENGIVKLSQVIKQVQKDLNKPQHLQNATHAHLKIELTSESSHKIILYFDNHDSKEIDKEHVQECDIYFKRSYSRDYINNVHAEHKDKINPLGLNYLVLPDKRNFLTFWRNVSASDSLRRRIGGIISSVDTNNFFKFHPRLRNLHSLPEYSLKPKVLFMVTAYDPYDDPDRLKEQIEERIYNNEFRANCVRLLRKELGHRFHGGFIHNKFTTAKYRDVLLDNPEGASKENYLRLLKEFPICIATTGLHGSIGWKFAEYIAFSKAILSERLLYEIPGNCKPEHNYLEFSSPESCLEQAIKLLENQQLRANLMLNNSIYYQQYVRPDMLVFNAISVALHKSNGKTT